MSLFDRFMSTYKGSNWMDGYVIRNGYLDEDETYDKWNITREPFLVTVWNGFWLLLDRKMLPINNVYVAICMWLMTVRRTRVNSGLPPDCLSDNTYIGDFIDSIIYGKGPEEYIVDPVAHKEYIANLKRGLPTDTTRVRI